MKLTDGNYYSVEADKEFMSCSQYQAFMECEAKQMAKLQGRWVDEPKEAFTVGNYLHSYFESAEAHKKFCEDNFNSIYKTKEVTVKRATKTSEAVKETVVTGKYAPYQQADKMIATLENDKTIKEFIDMPGENEKIVQGEIFGVPWRGKLDKYIEKWRMIIDYKTVANIWETAYNPVTKERETFVQTYGYLFRAAVYSLLEYQMFYNKTFEESYRDLLACYSDLCDFILICVSKQDYPDKELIRLNHAQEYIRALESVKENLYRITQLKAGLIVPKRCGTCDYCRATKKITGIKPYYELIPGLRTPREDDYFELTDTEEGKKFEYTG